MLAKGTRFSNFVFVIFFIVKRETILVIIIDWIRFWHILYHTSPPIFRSYSMSKVEIVAKATKTETHSTRHTVRPARKGRVKIVSY